MRNETKTLAIKQQLLAVDRLRPLRVNSMRLPTVLACQRPTRVQVTVACLPLAFMFNVHDSDDKVGSQVETHAFEKTARETSRPLHSPGVWFRLGVPKKQKRYEQP